MHVDTNVGVQSAKLEPKALGRYLVLDTLGSGGMGTVFEAHDPVLDRRVAVKILHENIDEQHTSRLIREAQALAKVSHPNVVQVYEVGRIEGRFFVAMELVKGQTLADWMRREPRPSWRRCVEVFHQAGQGLAAAHARGLVHRDFKPGNAILGEDDRVRVLDFGLARQVDTQHACTSGVLTSLGIEQPGMEAPLTRTGVVLGTPAYMALEQMEGSEADAQSDQFSFCVALYEALYGVRPFAGGTMAIVAFNIGRGRITPPPKGSRVPTWLDRLLRRGLAATPDRRFPSMKALLDALAHEARRSRLRLVWLTVLGLVVLSGGLSFALMPNRAPCQGGEAHLWEVWNDERSAAITAAFEATDVTYADDVLVRTRQRIDDYAETWVGVYTQVCEATAVHGRQSPEELDRRVSCLDARMQELEALLQVLGEADDRVVERAAQAASALRGPGTCASETLDDPETDDADPERKRIRQDLRTRMLRAEALEHVGRYDDAATLAREIAAEAELHGQTDLHDEALVQLGMAKDLAGDYPTAAEHLRQAYFGANAQGRHLVSAKAAVALVTTEGIHMARGEEGLSWARHAEVALQRGDPKSPQWGRYHSALGALQMRRSELVEARKHVEQAVALERDALGDDHERVAFLLTYLGLVLEQTGRSEDAVASFEQAIEIHRRALGPHHPDLAGLHNNYAVILFGRRDWPGAQVQLGQAVAIQRVALGDHPNTALSLDNLGGVLVLQGKVKEGRALIEQALAMREKTLGAEHPAVAQSLTNFAGTLAAEEDWDGAQRLYERALAIMEKADGPDNQQVVLVLTNLGQLDLREGAAQSGHDRCQQAAAIVEKEGGPTARDLPDPLMCLGWAQLELEQPQAALESLERALAIRGEGQADYGAMLRLLLSRALVKTGGDAERAAELRSEARTRYRKLDEEPPERVGAWLREPG
jgi:tetratricopeptide (TPR) repeat protein/tRNA A-37 threonylcarbamoyl transferase component Bud32